MADALWTSQIARDLEIQVEVRDGPADSFGKGRRVPTTFGALLDGGSPNLYLTTQEVPEGQLLAAPLTAIATQLPLRPALLGNLVPQSINLWLGRSQAPASSGLHHDFHDNLYVLLRGRKRFRLFSPADAHRMALHGRLRHVHSNGRINYVGQPPTTADGREPEDRAAAAVDAAQRAQRRAEARLQQAEEAADAEEPGAAEQLEQAEEGLDAAMDRVAAARSARSRLRKQQRRQQQGQPPPEPSAPGPAAPPSFSRIGNLANELGGTRSSFPSLAGARMAECELRAGELLYLPAGWFHEVSSDGGGASGGLHCALNYWYHPPQVGAPYKAPHGREGQRFWEREWRKVGGGGNRV